MNKKGLSTLIIVILVVLAIVVIVLIKTGIFEKAINPCEKEFSDCNYACGEGIFNSICKEKCTSNFRSCQEDKG